MFNRLAAQERERRRVRASDISGRRGHTVFKANWRFIEEKDGSRFVEGIAYNAAIRGERKRVTCSDDVWHCPDDDVFYWDEAIRWTVNELSQMDLTGKPFRIQHASSEELPPAGWIVHNYMDDRGNLRIIAEIPNDGPYGTAAINLMDNGTCEEFSVGYPIERDPVTKVVTLSPIDEVSMVNEAHFRGCRAAIKAHKRSGDNTSQQKLSAPYTTYRVVRASKEGVLEEKTEAENLEFGKMANNNNNTASGNISVNTGKSDHTSIGMSQTTPATQPPPAATTPPAQTGAPPAAQQQQQQQEPEWLKIKDEDKMDQNLLRNVAMMKKKFMQQMQQLQDKVNTLEAKDEQERAEYKAKNHARAEEITAHMKEIAKEIGGVEISDNWADINKQMLTDPKLVSQEAQAVQVACSRGFRQMQQKVQKLEEENAVLRETTKVGFALSNVDTVDEDERHERRQGKLSRRHAGEGNNDSLMQPDPEAKIASLPQWAQNFVNPYYETGRYVPPSERRDLKAARTPAPAQTQQAQQQPPPPSSTRAPRQQAPPQTEQRDARMSRTQPQQPRLNPNYKGRPNNSKSMSNNPDNHELYNFLIDVTSETDHTRGALAPLAGFDFGDTNGYY